MVECLLAAGVDFMLVGGYAVALERIKARSGNG